jgi:hypothetical protein
LVGADSADRGDNDHYFTNVLGRVDDFGRSERSCDCGCGDGGGAFIVHNILVV